ncbi:hypothetical protein ACFO4P_10770 [Epilithonimonas pallida]|uniref:Uncharacterized protein n=1 Tax=Epilithonimonas pallida TaxID=373671 RepID=A0ABY1R475_9FLAO|nr:hypothetical protein [Epilithonimonas pallida]SMP92482.1 hypothetical protein SAMN05421679_10470 [Epilithonimonas pallida]
MKFFKKLICSNYLPKYSGRIALLFLFNISSLFYSQVVVSGMENITVSAGAKIYIQDPQEAEITAEHEITIPDTPENPKKKIAVQAKILKKQAGKKNPKTEVRKIPASQDTVFKTGNQDNNFVFEMSGYRDFGISFNRQEYTSQKALVAKNAFAGFFLTLVYSGHTFSTENHHRYNITHSAFSSRPPPALQA